MPTPRCAEPTERREEPHHFVRRQARRRLVEHQDLRFGGERPGDGDERFLGAREALDADVGIDVGAEHLEGGGARACGRRVQSTMPWRRG